MSNDLADFVYFEAKEKIHETLIKGRLNFEKKKQELIIKGKKELDELYEYKLKKMETDYKIRHSQLVNGFRNNKLIERNKCLVKLLNKTQLELHKKCETDKAFYSDLLKKIIIESLIKLMEPAVIIKCLKRDVDLIKRIKDDCETEFSNIIKKELSKDMKVTINISEDEYLQEKKLIDLTKKEISDISKDDEEQVKISNDDTKCFGGVFMSNSEKTVICKNTLDIRTEMMFEIMLPEIRSKLFENN